MLIYSIDEIMKLDNSMKLSISDDCVRIQQGLTMTQAF